MRRKTYAAKCNKDKYNIRLNQIILITTDNGTNMIKTTKILSHSYIADNDFEGTEEVEKNIDYTKKIYNFENSEELHVGNIQICRCAAHTELYALSKVCFAIPPTQVRRIANAARNMLTTFN